MTDTLSDYEALRARNIERNNARLRALGLISEQEERDSNNSAWGKNRNKTFSEKEETDKAAGVKKRKRAKRDTTANDEATEDDHQSGSRKSLRLQGKGPENQGEDLLTDENESKQPSSIAEDREARVRECREIRLRRALEVSQAGADKAAAENPTASYEHCLMRIRSMTEKGLANRVKAIERAAGKHCVVKMAIFKSCLQDEGLWDLAELAADALERLKALKPPLEE